MVPHLCRKPHFVCLGPWQTTVGTNSHVVLLIQQNTVYTHMHPPLAQKKCFPSVDRVLIKGFWTHWLKETVTKLLSYFCSLTKVSAIQDDLFRPCAVGHAFHSGQESRGRGRVEGRECWLICAARLLAFHGSYF